MEYENNEINDNWLKNMKEIYKRYEKFDEIETNSILCMIFFISKKNEISEIIKRPYKLVKNSIEIENINKLIEEYTNEYRVLDIFQTYVPHSHDEIEKKIYEKNPITIKNVTNKDSIYYPVTTRYMKNLNNLIIFCKENTTMSLFTKKIRIHHNKKTHKNRKIYKF